MHNIPEEAVKAAADAAHEELMLMAKQMNVPMEYTQSISVNNYRVMRAALMAALPFIPVQGAQLSPKDRNTAEVGGLVDTLRSMSHDDNTSACVSVNITASNDLAKKLFDVLHAAQKAATALEAQEAELAAVHQRYVDADESRIDAEAALAEARKALKPFALVAEHDISEDEADSDAFRPMPKPFNHAPQITVGHLRSARRALEGGSQA